MNNRIKPRRVIISSTIRYTRFIRCTSYWLYAWVLNILRPQTPHRTFIRFVSCLVSGKFHWWETSICKMNSRKSLNAQCMNCCWRSHHSCPLRTAIAALLSREQQQRRYDGRAPFNISWDGRAIIDSDVANMELTLWEVAPSPRNVWIWFGWWDASKHEEGRSKMTYMFLATKNVKVWHFHQTM